MCGLRGLLMPVADDAFCHVYSAFFKCTVILHYMNVQIYKTNHTEPQSYQVYHHILKNIFLKMVSVSLWTSTPQNMPYIFIYMLGLNKFKTRNIKSINNHSYI